MRRSMTHRLWRLNMIDVTELRKLCYLRDKRIMELEAALQEIDSARGGDTFEIIETQRRIARRALAKKENE